MEAVSQLNGIAMEGYLLKKKRKKMQGMGRRYFRLSSTGEHLWQSLYRRGD
jgi:hypothetical protein